MPIAVFAVEKNDIVGLWYMPKNEAGEVAVAEIFEYNEKYYAVAFSYQSYESGKVVLPSKDINNPDPSLRERTLGKVIIVNEISFNGKKWDSGEIYDPSAGKYFYLSGILEDNGTELARKVSIDKAGILGIKITWTKVENTAIYEPIRKTDAELVAMIPNKRYK